jgi:DDE superfamily endonuclease
MKTSRRYASNKNTGQHALFASFVARLSTTTALLLEEEGQRRKNKKGRKKRRSPAMFDQRLQWEAFWTKHAGRPDLRRHLRMSADSFVRLLSFIRDKLKVDKQMGSLRGGAILPELCLYACLRYLAGGSYSDIKFFTGMSVPSVYRVIWKCIDAINACDELAIKFPTTMDEVKEAARGFETISTQGCIWNCVSVIDGYLLRIQTPSKSEVRNVRSFSSGHYQTHGLNIQAACDHHCRFTFLGVAGPGVMGDRDAINMVKLGSLVDGLPGLYCAIGDCAYTASEHLVPIFRGELAKRNDNFNFFASQLRIRIEMAFGLMVKKWGILSRPQSIKMIKMKKLMVAIARLHNFCINERLDMQNNNRGNRVAAFTPRNVQFTAHEIMLRDSAANFESEEMDDAFENRWSMNRDRMAKDIEYLQLTRPGVGSRVRKS